MRIEAFLDYNQMIKAIFETSDEEVKYAIECNGINPRLSSTISENIKRLAAFAPIEEGADAWRLTISDSIFIDISKTTGEVTVKNQLTAFETRMLAQRVDDISILSREVNTDFSPRTDLHTHFTGAIKADVLIDVARENDLPYPAKTLAEMGIDTSKYSCDDRGNVVFSQLEEADVETVRARLKIPIETKQSFVKMEDCYAFRGPFVKAGKDKEKNKKVFLQCLEALARDYQQMGVEYVESSFYSLVTTPEYMEVLEEHMPRIKEETGVDIRFLIGLSRDAREVWTPEASLDDIDKVIHFARNSRYIVGADFMGHELNQTLDFKEELQALARYAIEEDPCFAIRVHAGESAIFDTNMYDALKIVKDVYDDMCASSGKKLPMPFIRLGHGLHGLDAQYDGEYKPVVKSVADLMKEMGAQIEYNGSSNLSLDNIDDIEQFTVKKAVDRGIEVVLGTDGHDLYSTSSPQEVIISANAGVTREQFEGLITRAEQRNIDRIAQRDLYRQPLPVQSIPALFENVEYLTTDGKSRWTPAIMAAHRMKDAEVAAELDVQINHAGAITNEQEIEEAIAGKMPIIITGASKKAWPKITEQDQANVALAMQVLADVMNHEKVYIVTGGTNFGAEKTMHEAVSRRNKGKTKEEQLTLLGTFTMEATLDRQTGVHPDTITHAMIAKKPNGARANKWMELPESQLMHAYEKQGAVIALGGGPIVHDMIQIAYNLDMEMHLMDGPEGASTEKCRSLRGHDYGFKTPEDLVRRLYEKHQDIFVPGFSLDRIGEYVEQARAEMNAGPADFTLHEIAKIADATPAPEVTAGEHKLITAARDATREGGLPKDKPKETMEIGE